MKQGGEGQLSRVTLWRRRTREVGVSGRGRRLKATGEDAVRLAFVGAAVALFNRRGHLHYPELLALPAKARAVRVPGHRPFKARMRAGFGHPFIKAPAGVARALAGSGLPPALLAVAVCSVLPLNLQARASVSPDRSRASVSLDQSRADDFERGLVAIGYPPWEAGQYRAAAEADWTAAWVREFEGAIRREGSLARYMAGAPEFNPTVGDVDSLAGESAPDGFAKPGTVPNGARFSGTPAHRVHAGLCLSRRMACYWRQHPDFKWACQFVRGLLKHPAPRAPFEGGIARSLGRRTLKRRPASAPKTL